METQAYLEYVRSAKAEFFHFMAKSGFMQKLLIKKRIYHLIHLAKSASYFIRLFLMLTFCGGFTSLNAQQTTDVLGTALTQDMKVFLTPEICQKILIDIKRSKSNKTPKRQKKMHQTQSSKDVTYRGNVDTKGNALPPADLNASSVPLPKSIRIPIRYSKDSKLLDPGSSGAATGAFQSQFINEIPLGFVEYELETGNIMLNGQKLKTSSTGALKDACRTLLNK